MNNKCFNCGKPGHRARDHKNKKKEKKDKDKDKDKEGEESHMGDELVMFMADVPMDKEQHNFATFDANNSANNDEHLIYYDYD
jgi:hypothetical protein